MKAITFVIIGAMIVLMISGAFAIEQKSWIQQKFSALGKNVEITNIQDVTADYIAPVDVPEIDIGEGFGRGIIEPPIFDDGSEEISVMVYPQILILSAEADSRPIKVITTEYLMNQ